MFGALFKKINLEKVGFPYHLVLTIPTQQTLDVWWKIPHCTECREDLQCASTVSNVTVELLLELPSYVIKHCLI